MHKICNSTRFTPVIKFAALGVLAIGLAGCGTAPPRNTNNICSIFKEYPKWYWEAKGAQHKWGVPINVSLAIIRTESHFVDDAKPARTKLLGFIPWTRPTTAYGYSQAVNGTWKDYQRATGEHSADRDEFGDAVDFVGWYGNMAHRKLGISKNNAYQMYLAYHEGVGGFEKRSYRKKGWLVAKARNVARLSYRYKQQLKYCRADIPKPSIWNLWLM